MLTANNTLKFRVGVLSVFLFACLLVWVPAVGGADRGSEGELLQVSFLDVGQGDSIYVEAPGGKQMLIDGGPDGSVLRELGKVMSVFDRTIDVVVATHFDKDHIAGLVDVLERYEVGMIVMTENKSETSVSTAFSSAVAEENAVVVYARAGDVLRLGGGVQFSILSPSSKPLGWESNNSSIVGQLQYGEVEFMLTGDAGVGIENYLASVYGEQLESEVLKLGHHGSKTSTSEEFLSVVLPKYSVVSAGKDNRYNHPDPSVIDRVEDIRSEVLSTVEGSTVTLYSDGLSVFTEFGLLR